MATGRACASASAEGREWEAEGLGGEGKLEVGKVELSLEEGIWEAQAKGRPCHGESGSWQRLNEMRVKSQSRGRDLKFRERVG